MAGRTFRAEEHRPGASPVVVISRELWRREFNGAGDAIGKTITLNRTNYTVVGVVDGAPLRTVASPKTELWMPLERAVPYTQRGTHFLRVIARLKPGVGIDQARSDLKVLAHRLDVEYKTGHGITALPLREQLFGNVRLGLLLLLGAAGFLLLIATANVANILLARASARAKEFAIRAALRRRARAFDFPNHGRESAAFLARRHCRFSASHSGVRTCCASHGRPPFHAPKASPSTGGCWRF